ncbi:hypothetical protein A8F94_10180 [Bacillus sp. FJAT-27225]|uniref:Mbeg1-like protein n=1 Tax=Bacillus sp. FJAT-27225 TaxID=1743144 RepID=UPI00080C3473|nr:Mbeg1-like protein [Bacillus sp. FJAT-27225]OCA88168.1 hypothetical protein A8F94_10180 [Bacillus sp. FJAT-27225]
MNTLDPNLQEHANEAALLNVIMYLNIEDVGVKDGEYMSDIIVKLGDIYDAPGGFDAYMANHPSGSEAEYQERQRQYQLLANASSQNEHFSNLMIDNQSLLMDNPPYENGGLNATTFIDQDGNVTFVYRGTGGGEWLDNGTGLGGSVVATEQQKEAQEYFDRVIEANGWDKSTPIIDITGHSKGGNKIQFVTMTSEYSHLIRHGFSFDGQGMSPEAIAWLRSALGEEEFNDRRNKLYSIAADNDYVNILGTRIVPEDHIIYMESLLTKKAWHFPDSYLTMDGRFTDFASQGNYSTYLEGLSTLIMKLPSPIRNVITEGGMGFAHIAMSKGTALVNGGSISWAEMLGTIPLALQLIPGSTIQFIGAKFGMDLEVVSSIVTAVVMLAYAPSTFWAFGAGAAIDFILRTIDDLKVLHKVARNVVVLSVTAFLETAVGHLQSWINSFLNPGLRADAASPMIRVNTAKLRSYSQRLKSINNRISSLDRRMDSLYFKVGLLDILSLMQADLLTSENRRLARCIDYLEDTADSFERAERNILTSL